MSHYNQQTVTNTDEVSLRGLILLIQYYFNVLLKSWWIIILCGLLGGGILFYLASIKKTTYEATLTYTAAEGNTAMNGAMGLIGGFLGSGDRSNPLTKAQAMATTQKIGREALFKKVEVDGINDYLINHHARIYEVEEFVPFENAQLATRKEREQFKLILSYVHLVFEQSIEDNTGIALMTVKSLSEDYSIQLANNYYNSIIEFYKKTEVGQQQQTLDALQNRADSLYSVIQSTAYSIAKTADNDKGIFWAVDRVPGNQATAELSYLTSAYQELIKNLETIKFSVATNTPKIEVIDYPMSPLKKNKDKKLIKALIGLIIGIILSSGVILARQILIDILAHNDENEEHLVPD